MDWGNVAAEELFDALREVEWSTAPRPLVEFFQKFTIPKNAQKWQSRLKCNIYYYRTNYYLLAFLILGIFFFRRPLVEVALVLWALAIACLNDSFAIAFSERATRAIRKVSPPLAAKLRPPHSRPSRTGRPLKSATYICGQDRTVVVTGIMALSALFVYFSRSAFQLAAMLLVTKSLMVLHATFRSPNLKARLNSFREEFRAVWRGYSDAP